MVLTGGLTVGSGQVLTQALSFMRNVIIARLISPADFGIAAMFAMTFSLLDMISNVSADKLLIQAEDGDAPSLQNTAQLIHFGRGLMNSLIIFALAFPIAHLFGVPQARWAFECLALAPLLRGFIHLDTFRLQREMRFRPAVTVDVGSQILVTVAALPLAFWLRDYSAMLWVLILQAASAAIMSHVVAERPYGWTWDGARARRIFSFGWPLLVNGILLFIIMDGDRFMIGSAHHLFPRSTLSLADLGVYSVAFAVTMGPAMLILNVSGPVFFPLLSRTQEFREQFERRYSACAQFLCVAAAAAAIPFVLLGGWLVVTIYGAKYAAASGFIAWLSGMWSLRVVRAAPTMAALALGDSKNSMYSNIARTVALAGALTAVAIGAGLVWIAVSGFGGELFALLVCLARLRREHGVRASGFVSPFAVYAASVLTAAAAARGLESVGPVASMATAASLVALACVTMLIAFPKFRSDVGGLVLKSGLTFSR